MQYVAAGAKLHFRALDIALGWGQTWRVTTKVKTADVYVEAFEGRRWMHGSHHASGQSHYALERKALRDAKSHVAKYFATSLSPLEIAPGVEHLAHIMVPADQLSIDWTERGTPSDVIDVPLPLGSGGLAFDVFRARGDAEVTLAEATPVAGAFCGPDARVAVVARPLLQDGDLLDLIHGDLMEARTSLASSGASFPTRLAWLFHDLDRPGLQVMADVLVS